MGLSGGFGRFGGDPGDPRRSGWRRRMRRPWVPLGLLVLLAVLIAVLPRHSLQSRTLPPGRWGATIRCLERNTSFRVSAFGTGRAPERSTTTIAVARSNLGHRTLAELRQAASPAAAREVASANRFGEVARADYRTDGRIVWAYVEGGTPPRLLANAGERALIDACVRNPRR